MNAYHHLTVCIQISSNDSFKKKVTNKLFTYKSYSKVKFETMVVGDPPIAGETGVQSQVESYQSLKKWYLIPPC